MKFCLAAATLVFVATLHAQDLAPELLPAAMKYRADTAALNTQQKAAMDRVAQVYGTALDAVEKAETTTGHLATITAILQERGDLKKAEVKSDPPKDLPKVLYSARKTYLEGLARIIGDFTQRQQRIATDYLRLLSATQTRAGGNAALAGQITEEKERALTIAAAYNGAEFERLLIGAKWTWDGRFPITFQREGKSTSPEELSWKTVKPFTIQYSFPNGNHGTIDFEQGMIRATITETHPDGAKARLALVRAKE